MQRTLTSGPITSSILLFALPLMFGNLLQQMYNIADTWVVGRFLGADVLAAVGSSYTLMTFLTSILLGLCMGSGAAISMQYGSGEYDKMRQSVFQSFALIAGMALVLNLLVYLGLDGILWVLRVPEELKLLMKDYLVIIFLGIPAPVRYSAQKICSSSSHLLRRALWCCRADRSITKRAETCGFSPQALLFCVTP
jgi:Na+-driven multidrug efflux pump